MTTYSFDTVVGQTLAFDVDADDLNIAYGADVVTLTESGGNLIISVANVGSVTLSGVNKAQLVGSGSNQNISVASGQVYVGDNTTSDALDSLDDTIGLGASDDANLVYGYGGGDDIDIGDGANVVYGGEGVTDSTDGNDDMDIGAGSNLVYGNAGNDAINFTYAATDSGANTVFGGLGNDVVDANDGAATTSGGSIWADLGPGDDSIAFSFDLEGGATIMGGADEDTINLTNLTGDATVYGGTGLSDSTDGGDVITQGAGNATIYGNAGNDDINLVGKANGETYVNGGLGVDSIDDTAGNAVGVFTVAGGWDADVITLVDIGITAATVYGGNGLTDTGDSGTDTITVTDGGALDSLAIYGNGGADSISVDLTDANVTAATINGGLGNDTVTVSTAGASNDTATINVSAGNDNVTLTTGAFDSAFTLVGYDTDDTVTLNFNSSPAADFTVATGSNSIVVDDGGNHGSLIFSGYTGSLSLTLADGTFIKTNATGTAATLTGSDDASGGDYLESGSADDTFSFDDATSDFTLLDVVKGGAGTDTISFVNNDADIATEEFANVTSVEQVVLADGANGVTLGDEIEASGVITIDGSASSGVLTLDDDDVTDIDYIILDGSAAANIDLDDATGNLHMTLLGGADDVVAGSGNDTILAGEGADVIEGGDGADVIDLGAGADEVEYTAKTDGSAAGTSGGTFSGHDVVTTFTAGTDKIDLDISVILDGANETNAGITAGDTGTIGSTTNVAFDLDTNDSDELLVFGGADADSLTSVNYVVNALNAMIASGSFASDAGDTSLIVFNATGGGSAVYLFTEDDAADTEFNAADLQLLCTTDATLSSADFTVF